jgi:hypothetical protein
MDLMLDGEKGRPPAFTKPLAESFEAVCLNDC